MSPAQPTTERTTQLLSPDRSLSTDENLIGLVATLAAFTSDRRSMTRDQISQWAALLRTALMADREGTLDDVFDSAAEWLSDSRFFPTIADIGPLVERRVIARRESAIIESAQRSATPLPRLESGDVDWSNTRTADLPPGYDFSQDEDWQKGQALFDRLYENKSEPGPLARTVLDIKRRMDEQGSAGFQGASKPAQPRCRRCGDAGWLRTGGGFNPSLNPDTMGTPGSHVIRCPHCYSDRIILNGV